MTFRAHTTILVFSSLLFSNLVRAQDSSLDIRLFRQINNGQSTSYGAIELIDQTSFPLFVSIPAGILLYGGLADNRSAVDTGTLLVASQALSLGTAVLFKSLTDRPRPYEALSDVKVKRLSNVSGSSFPSGHSAQAFAIATMLAYRAGPIIYIPAFVWAAFVGYGRVYLGVHYPSDVLGGMAIGILSSVLVNEYRDSILAAKNRLLNTDDPSAQYIRLPENSPLIRLSIAFH
jgi:undecaprenyl-diphosphatase